MKHDYSKLDSAILKALAKKSPIPFHVLSDLVRKHSEELESAVRGKGAGPRDDKPAWRFVDSRLQALRKAGKIRYQRKPEGWVLVQQEGGAA